MPITVVAVPSAARPVSSLSLATMIHAEKALSDAMLDGTLAEHALESLHGLPRSVAKEATGFDRVTPFRVALRDLLGPSAPNEDVIVLRRENPNAHVDNVVVFNAMGKIVATGDVRTGDDHYTWSTRVRH